MSAEARFYDFVLAEFVGPNHKCSESLDAILDALKTDDLWYARALVVKHSMHGDCSEKSQTVLSTYSRLCETNDVNMLLEAARAAAVFEEPELMRSYLEGAQSIVGFTPSVTGVRVKYGPHQVTPSLRMTCLAESKNEPATARHTGLENVALASHDNRFSVPEIVSESENSLARSGLSNTENLILLLRAEYARQIEGVATSVSNEQVLPFVHRVTESANFSNLDLDIQRSALFERSVLELKDINELERGGVQLLKLGAEAQTLQPSSWSNFHMLMPLSWKTIDEYAARRLVAMSDFGNAIPIYRRLDRKYDLAICLASTDATSEALEVLEQVEPKNGNVLLLMGDLATDPNLWERAWNEFRIPKAKLRLARAALAKQNLTEALNHIRDLLSASANDHEALLLGSSIAMSTKDWDLAADYLRRALALKEDDAQNWSNLATALIQLGQPDPALHALKQAIRVNQNAVPDFATYANYISLSAQLGMWDDAVTALLKLVEAADSGSAAFIAKVSPVFPRLVHHYVTQKYVAAGMQKFVLDLFTQKMNKVILADDPVLQRLNAKLYIWSGNYQAGLKHFVDSVDALLQAGLDFSTDARARARLELYAAEAIEALEKYGDCPGRIEGSKAYPGWKIKVMSIEQTVKRST